MRIVSLASGSSGNCIYIENEDTRVLVDAGISCRRIVYDLKEIGVDVEDLSAVLVTHEHSDHIKGLRVLAKKYDLPVYANEKTWAGMENEVSDITEKNKKYLEMKGLELADLKIDNFSVSHDAADPVGYCFHSKETTFAMATDTGYINDHVKKHLTGADVIYMEANYDVEMLKTGQYPGYLKRRILSNLGHLSNVDAGMGLTSMIDGNTHTVALAHLSQENNIPDLAHQTVQRILDEVQISVELKVTARDCIKEIFNDAEV